MTTVQVHLVMLGLGLVAYLFLAGLLSNRKTYSRRLRQQWWMGAVAGIAVAASPLSRFWRQPENGIDLLTQSLLVAAICLLALLLLAVLRYPLRKFQNRRKQPDDLSTSADQNQLAQQSNGSSNYESTPIVINADGLNSGSQNNLSNVAKPPSAEVTIDRSLQDAAMQSSSESPLANTQHIDLELEPLDLELDSSPHNKTVQSFVDADRATADDLIADEFDDVHTAKQMRNATVESDSNSTTYELESPIDAIADEQTQFNPNEDQANTRRLSQAEIESVMQMQAKQNNPQRIDEQLSQSSAANDHTKSHESTPTPVTEDKLDLSETEQLFAEIRQQKSEVQLPKEEELRQAKANSAIDELDLETQLIQDDHNRLAAKSTDQANEVIEEAEVVELDSSSLDFGNDLTGEYAHPTAASEASTLVRTDEPVSTQKITAVPETLDEAIIAAKVTAVSLQAQVSNLENSITELDDLRDATIDATIDAAQVSAEHNDALLKQKDDLLKSEDAARSAAESVIAAQSALIDRAKRQQALVNRLLKDERQRLGVLQEEVERSRKMARTAANLARRAAIAQQEIKDVAKREQAARLKSQESTRKAVTIARNAISALAAEERKRGITRH